MNLEKVGMGIMLGAAQGGKKRKLEWSPEIYYHIEYGQLGMPKVWFPAEAFSFTSHEGKIKLLKLSKENK